MLPQRTAGHKIVMRPSVKERIEKGLCPSCEKPKSEWKRRTDWTCCSTDCTEIYWRDLVLYNGWSDLREKVFKRDNHRCFMCGSDGWDKDVFLIADHIIPIALGGDEWDIDNIQTLCSECDKIKTAADIKKIAVARRVDKNNSLGQTQLIEINMKCQN